MKTYCLYAVAFMLLFTACGGAKSRQEEQPAAGLQADSVENVAADPAAIEGIARQLYLFVVLSQEPDYDFLQANCTPGFVERLAAAYDYDDGGYAIWMLRTGVQDGDGPTDIIDVSAVGDRAVEVDYVDMGRQGSTILHFDNDNRVEDATRPDGTSVFDMPRE